MPTSIAYFVSPHGFGHAARSAAVMEALHELEPRIRFQVFTTVPAWFFHDSLHARFTLHPVTTDVGLVQKSSLEEDPAATVRALASFLPLREERVRELAKSVRGLGCRLLVTDISPLGIAVARAAEIPSVLVENFTWDWIYNAYTEAEPGLRPFLTPLCELYASVGLHIQTEPCCRRLAGAPVVPPAARRFRGSVEETRRRLGLGDSRPMVLLTMGGVEWEYSFLDRLTRAQDLVFVVPGGAERSERRENLVLLPHRSPVYHPDLVAAADLVVGKAGYSTVAEAYRAGTRLALVERPHFPESAVLADFVRRHLPSLEIRAEDFPGAEWLDRLPDLLARGRPAPRAENGADQIASRLLRLLD
ncbi:MAG: hypothetical protein V3T81_05500 [Thermoanaerobaculia bacterium]